MTISFDALKAGYADLWQRMEIRPERLAAVNQIANRLIGFKARYQTVSQTTGVPWFVIAAIHNRESDASFTTYLGNGEPLNRVTRLVPAGRGPFSSWEAGAIDALSVDGLDQMTDWSPEHTCYAIEKYNGFGYRSQHVNSPYLWSFSNLYQSGKYVSDGQFNPSAIDPQCGTMPIIKQIMALDLSTTFAAPAIVVPVGVTSSLAFGSRGDRVTQLQNALKQRGYPVGTADGIYGTVTRDAVTAFQRDAKLPATGIADAATLAALATPAPVPTPAGGGITPPPQLQPEDILRILFGELAKQASSAQLGGTPGAPVTATDILQQIFRAIGTTATSTTAGGTVTPGASAADILQQVLRAFVGATPAPTTAGANVMPTTATPIILTPIDKMLGGEALAGNKTSLAIIAYVVMAILQAVGVVGSGTPAGIIVNTIIAAFGGLGVLSKIDRAIQTLGVIAAKPPA